MSTVPELLDLLERSLDGGAWHGPALFEALGGIDAVTARARPIAGAHSIWEIVHHLTTWHEVPLQRIDGAADRVLAADGDWPGVPHATTPEAWQASLEALRAAHHRLRQRIAALSDEDLARAVAGSGANLGDMILGVVQHNAYHGGQVSLLRKFAP